MGPLTGPTKTGLEQACIDLSREVALFRMLALNTTVLFMGTTLLGFGWSIGRRQSPPPTSALVAGTSPAARAATTAAIALVCILAACGDGATAPTAGTPAAPRKADDREQKTLSRLLGRWQRAVFEDVVFGDDGYLLVDGPGPLDISGSYELLGAKRIRVNWGTGEFFIYTIAFIEDKLRLTLEDSTLGDGWTLTRRK